MKRFIFIALLLLCPNAFAATYHVCNTAQGNGGGSSQANCVSEAFMSTATILAGDTVNLYDDTGDFNSTWNIQNSGASGNRITIQAATGEEIWIDQGTNVDGGWTLVSGTDGVDAIYQKAIDGNGYRVLVENDLGLESWESSCNNVPKPLPGGVVGTGSECLYTNRTGGIMCAQSETNCDVFKGNGEFKDTGTFTQIRTSGADNPSNYNLTMTSAAVGINLNGNDYITIDGINVRHAGNAVNFSNSDNIIYKNFKLHNNAGYQAVRLENTTNYEVTDCEIRMVGSRDANQGNAVASTGTGSNGLTTRCEIEGFGHAGISTKHDNQLATDNYLHSFNGKPFTSFGENNDNVFVFNNRIRDCPGVTDQATTSGRMCLEGGSNNYIASFNQIWAGTGHFVHFEGCSSARCTEWHLLHNTITRMNRQAAQGSVFHSNTYTGNTNPNVVVMKNNIFDNIDSNNSSGCVGVTLGGALAGTPPSMNFDWQGNVFRGVGGCAVSFHGATLSTWETNYPSNLSNNTTASADVDFVSYLYSAPDLRLNVGSDGIDDGVFLAQTTTSCSGNPTQVTLDDAGWIADSEIFITNGWLTTLSGNPITIGDDTGLLVTNRTGNVITLDASHGAVSCNVGDYVSFDYVSTGPDAGYKEFGATGGLPVAIDDTMAGQTVGYDTVSFDWDLLTANDIVTGATTDATISDVVGTTTSLCTVANNVGTTSIDVMEGSGQGPCSWTSKVTDTEGESVTSSTTSMQVTGAGGSSVPTSFVGTRTTDDCVSPCTSLTPGEPASTVEGDLLIAFQYNRNTSSPSLNTGWTNIENTVTGVANRISYIIRGASAPDLDFNNNIADERGSVVVLRVTGHDPVTPIAVSAEWEQTVSDANKISPDITTTSQNNLAIRVCFARANTTGELSWASSGASEFEEDISSLNNTISYQEYTQATAGSIGGTEAVTLTNASAGYCASFAVQPASGGSPTVLSDTFTEAGDVDLKDRAASPTAGTTSWQVTTAATCDVFGATDDASCDTDLGANIGVGVLDQQISIDWSTDSATKAYFVLRGNSTIPDVTSGIPACENCLYLVADVTADTNTLFENVGGVNSQIGSYAQIYAASTTYAMTFNVTDDSANCTNTSINILVDGLNEQTLNTASCLKGTFFGFADNATGSERVDNLLVLSDQTPDATSQSAPTISAVGNDALVTVTITPTIDAESGTEGYSLEKDDCAAGAYTELIYTLDNSGTSAQEQDIITTGQTCKYRVRMRDNSGNYSSYSNVVEHTFTSNTAPTCGSLVNVVTASGEVTVTDVVTKASCSDADGDTMVVSAVVTQPPSGAFALFGNENLQYTSDLGFEGTDSGVVTVSDQAGGTTNVTVDHAVSGFATGTRFVEGRLRRQESGDVLTSITGVKFSCVIESNNILVDQNFIPSVAYEVADQDTDAAGVFKIPLYSANSLSIVENDEVLCVLIYDDATATNGYVALAARLSVGVQ